MDITSEHKKIVQHILKKNLPSHAHVFIFGSRVTKAKKKFSDLDLAIDATDSLSISTLASLEHDFSESDLPYKVDIVDLNNLDDNFLNQIKADMVLFWNESSQP